MSDLYDKWKESVTTVYDSQELSTLELLEDITNFNDEIAKGIDDTNDKIDRELKNKTDINGDHKGSWQGLTKPTLSDEGMRATVEKLNKDITQVNAQLEQNTSKLDRVSVNIRYLGAKSNDEGLGNFDNSQAIDNAIASLNGKGGVIYFPPGEYRISRPIRVPIGVILQGSGTGATRIMLNAESNCNVIELLGNEWGTETYQGIRDLRIIGHYARQTSGTSHGIYGEFSNTYVYINNVIVENCKDDGMRFVSSHRNIVTNSVFRENLGNGVTLINGTDEGVATQTDNHVELGYCISSNNGGHGFYFKKPIDTKCIHLMATANTLDGFYFDTPSGNWANMINTIMAQNNRNGVNIYMGADLNIANIGVSRSSEYNIKIVGSKRITLSNVSLLNFGIGNMYVSNTKDNIFKNLTLQGTADKNNLIIEQSARNIFDGLTVIGGLDGIWLNTISQYNTFNNVNISETTRHGAFVEGGTYTKFNNINISNIGTESYPDSCGIELHSTGADYTQVSNFSNTDTRNPRLVKYGINVGVSKNFMGNMIIAKGKTKGLYVATTNTTSKIGTELIDVIY